MSAWETILECAAERKYALTTYRTCLDGKDRGVVVMRMMAPYSVRERNGVEYFYGDNAGQIKCFVKDQILSAFKTSKSFEPEWTVELQ